MYPVLRQYARRRLRAMSRWRPGLPPGLRVAASEAIAAAAGQPCVGFRYRTIAVARTGEQTHRLVARLESGEEYSAVYHLSPAAPEPSSVLDGALREAVSSFEMTERVVLTSVAGTALNQFIPTVLFFDATPRALHYVVEELKGHPPAGESVAQVAGKLPALHQALSQWAETKQPRLATRHGHYFARVSHAMEEILRRSGDRSAAALLDNWQAVVGLHASPDAGNDRQPIHGDFHRWNVFLTDTAPGIKVIDWDSVVWGDPFVDLATLLIEENADRQKAALDAYATAGSLLDAAEVERRYLVNRFQVSLLWSCLIASEPRWFGRARVRRRHLDEAARLFHAIS